MDERAATVDRELNKLAGYLCLLEAIRGEPWDKRKKRAHTIRRTWRAKVRT